MERLSNTLCETNSNDSVGYFDQVSSGSSSIFQKEKNCFSVANYLLSYAKKRNSSVDNLKLQKLLYYAQAWHLVFRGKPLFRERIEAWVHGPVVPLIYREYRKYGYLQITNYGFNSVYCYCCSSPFDEAIRFSFSSNSSLF